MRVAFLGFGLIGGSIARALAARSSGAGGQWSLTAWTRTGEGPRAAAAAGVIERAAADPGRAVAGADLIVLAAPPLACLELLAELAGPLRRSLPGAVVVTDVASTKRRSVERAASLGLRFVGGHPMAGRETGGYDAADADLLVGRPWVVCDERAEGAAVDAVERLVRATGARPIRMSAAAHDDAVATISHLPLVLSVALAEATAGRPDAARAEARSLAAGGWESMTRLARGDVEMGAGILTTNADLIADRLRLVRTAIDDWITRLEASPDAGDLRDRLARARSIVEGDD